jgi:hypothetical protein
MFLSSKYIFTDSLLLQSLGNLYSYDKILEIIILYNKLAWISYLVFPFMYTLKIICISILILIGIKLFEIEININNCIKIVLLAELIPLLSSIIKILYFYIYPPTNLEVLQYFNPLGVTSFLKNDIIPKYLLYPIQQLTLFEVGYWLLLAYGIKSLGNVNFKKALKITSLSYGVGLLIWCIFIVFLQLQFS